MLSNMSIVDLTIPLGPGVIMWPGSRAPEVEVLGTVERDGFYARRVSFAEHSGTHLDAPSHFAAGQDSVDQIPVASLVRPAVVIDISSRINGDADAVLELADVMDFESKYGLIPERAAILLRTGWEEFNEDAARYAGLPGELKFPGFGVEASKFLVEERKAAGFGIDTLGIDSGSASDFPVHSQITLPNGIWHLENLQNLKQLPALGAWIVVGALPLVAGSGSPARVIALVP